MASKADFSVEEWDLLRKTPNLIGLMVMVADPSGPIGVFKESAAAAAALREGFANAQTELGQVLAADLKENWTVHRMEKLEADEVRAMVLAACRQLSEVLRAKATEEEVIEIKDWLLDIARKVGAASREGTFLGFGGIQLSEAEKIAIDQIEVALR